MYLDANNLYGWAMSQPLSTGGFKWVKNDKWNDIFTKKDGTGYFVEYDLVYPENLHDSHNDYPLAPEKKLVVQDEWLSPYCKNMKEKFNLTSDKTTKLILTLAGKKNTCTTY